MPRVWESSTVITASFPTSSMMSAKSFPIAGSLAEMVATCDVSPWPETALEIFFKCSTMTSVARWMPRCIPTGFVPAARFFKPSVMMVCARSVAVVVPSPATSFVFVATSLTSSAPRFSILSSSSISLAMVTPSLVMVGTPKPLSSTTFRPFGPSVTLTASASLSTPLLRAWRAVSLKRICFAIVIIRIYESMRILRITLPYSQHSDDIR